MEIVIATGAMAFGPTTLMHKSLGGSETAALQLGKALAAKGHQVRHFCNLPPEGQPDAWISGEEHTDGVKYCALDTYPNFALTYSIDLLIVTRDPGLVACVSRAAKKVLWMHDVATKRGMRIALDQMAWTFDEIWTVSEWHRQQVAAVTGYPLSHIVALRNGIVPVKVLADAPRSKKQIVFASRPERGLQELLQVSGVMENLPDYNLVVCMYAHFPDHMKGYYKWVFERMEELPNVKYLGPKTQQELRQIIHDSAAYIYPTQFEETSCILARECIEQGTPFLTTKTGALPETLGECGIFFEDWVSANNRVMPAAGSPQWCEEFAKFFTTMLPKAGAFVSRMSQRKDLYWDGVAELVEQNAKPRPVTTYSRVYSLMQDGDIIPARALLDSIPDGEWTDQLRFLAKDLAENYPFLLPESDPAYRSMRDHYEWVYTHKKDTPQTELIFSLAMWSTRSEAMSPYINLLARGSTVLEYGCGCGHLLAPFAVKFPHLNFIGIDISQAAVDVINNAPDRPKNLVAYRADMPELLELFGDKKFEAAIISEVLEHVTEPWVLVDQLEAWVVPGGKVMTTTPFGPWEIATFRAPGRWHERAHIWLLDPAACFDMFANKTERRVIPMPVGHAYDERVLGNTLCVFDAGGGPSVPIDPLRKAMRHPSQQSVLACVIAMNAASDIVRMLESIRGSAQWINLALGPSTDNTRALFEDWMLKNPWIGYTIIDVPQIEPYKFGFDDARNASTVGKENFDWQFWIDTDEYLSGNFGKYLRHSALDGLTIPQHHFTTQPRGSETQIDRPARVLRVTSGFKALGHIHEHFELPGGGIGRCFTPPEVDLGHTGYVNEAVRKDRFSRNFPFLEWDDSEPKKRKLHHFLWFRDMIHRVRILRSQDKVSDAVRLAQEAIVYYNTHWEALVTFGQGFHAALAYVAELREFLGEGTPMEIHFKIDDQHTSVKGRFKDTKEIETVVNTLFKGELEDRGSRYW
jgi:glycosyltransferase involved in cell wall biosynthesis